MSTTTSPKCPICSNDIAVDNEVKDSNYCECSKCNVSYHRQCYEFNGRCAIYGCDSTDLRYEPIVTEITDLVISENNLPSAKTTIDSLFETYNDLKVKYSCLPDSVAQQYALFSAYGKNLSMLHKSLFAKYVNQRRDMTDELGKEIFDQTTGKYMDYSAILCGCIGIVNGLYYLSTYQHKGIDVSSVGIFTFAALGGTMGLFLGAAIGSVIDFVIKLTSPLSQVDNQRTKELKEKQSKQLEDLSKKYTKLLLGAGNDNWS